MIKTKYLESANNIFLPVLEAGVVLAAFYTKSCGRNEVTPQDIQLGLMFSARNVLGKQIGSLYPEVYEGSSEEEDEEENEAENYKEFSVYMGKDEQCLAMNECALSWSSWIPETPAEQLAKKTVDQAAHDFPALFQLLENS